MDKFLLAENPMHTGEICVVHMLNPVAIFRCFEGHITFKEGIFKHYQFNNSDKVVEEWTLLVHHLMTTDFITGPEEQATPLMDRAWRWLRAYFEWEDKNINNDDYAEEN